MIIVSYSENDYNISLTSLSISKQKRKKRCSYTKYKYADISCRILVTFRFRLFVFLLFLFFYFVVFFFFPPYTGIRLTSVNPPSLTADGFEVQDGVTHRSYENPAKRSSDVLKLYENRVRYLAIKTLWLFE